MIVNILCERKFENMILNPKLIFVGACNPYRVKSTVTYQENVGIKKKQMLNSQTSLVHLVKPLPDKAIEFVWDFGALKHQEIREYVNSMLRRVKMKQIEMFVELVSAVHQYFQESEDLSSVSLRDVNRFIRLNEWFVESIEKREKSLVDTQDERYLELKNVVRKLKIDKTVRGSLLAFFHCYYLRISNSEQRDEFFEVVMTVLSNHLPHFNKLHIEQLLKFEQLDFIHRMLVPEGIALNQALIENIFAIVPCLMNRIPVFICGKPGCSKSLAIQIISSSIRGEKSKDAYFRTMPELQIVSFQGSDSCTSEGVEEVFNKAEKILLNYGKHILPVVLFDEIGLAEVSRYNPLKVLHRLLEAENCKVGFIAISNWRLDASKMNRALYLARPDPNQDDLVETATTLLRSLGADVDDESMRSLAQGYYNMKLEYRNSQMSDFYGLRDFYHMIKSIGRSVREGIDLEQAVQHSLQRNFNGLEETKFILKETFEIFFNREINPVPVVDLIRENLDSRDSRYLMIICARDVSIYLQSTLVKDLLPNSRLIIGSTLENDVLQENTRFRVLSDIIGFMEQGIPIVLQNMEIIYSSLYDLFNQNFTKLGNTRRYCRIALGAQFNPKCFVNDSFKSIVFLDNDEETLQSADAPFLNRFEKHHVVLREILSDECILLSDSVISWVHSILRLVQGDNKLKPISVFPLFSPETINLYIKLNESFPDLESKTKRFFLSNSTMDILILCKLNQMSQSEKDFLSSTWKSLHQTSFSDYLWKLCDPSSCKINQVKMISVTYDSLSIDYLKETWSEYLQIEKCCNFKSEEDLKKNLSLFINNSKSIYLFEVDYSKEQQHLRFIVNLIERVLQENVEKIRNRHKNVFILIRMARNDENRLPLCLFQGWRYKMFEDLARSSFEIADEIGQLDTKTIVANDKIFKFEDNVAEICQRAVETLVYSSNLASFDEITKYKDSIQQSLTENEKLVLAFKKRILAALDKFLSKSRQKWELDLFMNEKIIYQACSVKDALRIYVFEKFLLEFTKLVVLCEKKSVLGTVVRLKDNEYFLELWVYFFDHVSTLNLQVQLVANSNQLKYTSIYSIPFIFEDMQNLKTKFDEYKLEKQTLEMITAQLPRFHSESCLWKSSSDLFYSNEHMQLYFIKDFIQSVLTDQGQGLSNIFYLYTYMKSFLSSSNLNTRIPILLDSKEKIIVLNKILILFSDLSTSNELSSYIQIFSNDSNTSDQTQNFFEYLTRDILPNTENIKKFSILKEYSLKLSIFLDLTTNFYPDFIDKEKLKFFIQLSRLENEDLLIQTSFKVQNEGLDSLFEFNQASHMLDQLSSNEILQIKFKVFLLNQLISKSPEFIQYVVRSINETEIWKYSVPLVESLIEVSQIESEIRIGEASPSRLIRFLKEKNRNLAILSTIMQKSGLNCRFSVLLADRIALIENVENLGVVKDLCLFYLNLVDAEMKANADDSALRIAVACGRIRSYLHVFTQCLNREGRVNEPGLEDMARDVQQVLGQRENLVFELFVLKELKSLNGDNLLGLKTKVRNVRFDWKHDIRNIGIGSNLHIFPYFLVNEENYRNLVLKIQQIKVSLDVLDLDIRNSITPQLKLEFGLAIINQIYLQYKFTQFTSATFINWFRSKQDLMINSFGEAFTKFLNLLVCNFPQGSLLHIYPNIEDIKFYKAQAMISCILVFISYQMTENSLSCLIFDENGRIVNDILARVNSLYVLGSEISKMQDYLKYMRDNFEALKSTTFRTNYSKGGSYVCSNTCDYFYIVNNCGGTTEKRPCPFCEQEIGGTSHRQVQREGHRNLSDDEARAYLSQKCDFYRNTESRGLNISDNNLILSSPRTLRLQSSYYFMNFTLNSILYFAGLAGFVDIEQLAQAYRTDIVGVIEKVEKIVNLDFRELLNNQNGENCFYWILGCLTKLTQVVEANYGDFYSNERRCKFEKDFEDCSTAQDISSVVNGYKAVLMTQLETSPLVHYLEELEKPPETNYALSEFFRTTNVASWADLCQCFLQSPRKLELRTLNLLIENIEESKNLSYFYPILHFTRTLISEFSFKISRQEANQSTIKQVLQNHPHLLRSLKNFLESWTSLNINLTFDCKTFEKIKLDENSLFSYFLVDNDLNSNGIFVAAALRSLGDLQNRIRGVLNENDANYTALAFLSNANEEDIFALDEDFLENLAQGCSICRLEYGRGKEIFYDYDRVQMNVEDRLAVTKMLDTQKLETMQYQYELLNSRSKYSGIIEQIRSTIRQESMSEEEFSSIERTIKSISSQTRTSELSVLNELYSWLNRLLSILLQQNLSEVTTVRTMNLFNLKFTSKIKIDELIFDLPISKLTSLFEMIEVKAYPQVVKSIGQQFKFELGPELNAQDLVEGFKIKVCEDFGNEVFEECQKVLRRIACRLLTANMDENFRILDYFGNENYWSLRFVELCDRVAEGFPPDFKFMHAVQVEMVFDGVVRGMNRGGEEQRVSARNVQVRRGASRMVRF